MTEVLNNNDLSEEEIESYDFDEKERENSKSKKNITCSNEYLWFLYIVIILITTLFIALFLAEDPHKDDFRGFYIFFTFSFSVITFITALGMTGTSNYWLIIFAIIFLFMNITIIFFPTGGKLWAYLFFFVLGLLLLSGLFYPST